MPEPATIKSKVDEECLASGLIASGNVHDAMYYLDLVEAGINRASDEQIIDALRYWMGEAFAAKHYKQD